jgi:hypothetical protein
VFGVRVILAALVFAAGASSDRVSAQEPQRASLAKPRPEQAQISRPYLSKTELAARFRDIKNGYSTIRATAAKYLPLGPGAPVELRVARMRIAAGMRSYEVSENQAQKQRDQLNLLIELTPLESLRLEMSMNRLAKMQAMIAGLMQTMNEAGDAMIANGEAANGAAGEPVAATGARHSQ